MASLAPKEQCRKDLAGSAAEAVLSGMEGREAVNRPGEQTVGSGRGEVYTIDLSNFVCASERMCVCTCACVGACARG